MFPSPLRASEYTRSGRPSQPALSASKIRTALTSTALDIEAPGVDRDSGFGRLDAFAAVRAVIAVELPPG
jgi:hypothetical protein